MTKYCFVVLSNPTAGREADYNHWYNDVHLADVLAVPGFVSAQRFKIANPDSKLPHKYLALYEIETDHLQNTLAELKSRAGTSAMPLDESLDLGGVSANIYEAITRRVSQQR